MIGCTLDANWIVIGAMMFALLMFGAAYNALVHWLYGRHQGYTSLLVAGGVVVTLIGVAIISWQAALLCGAAFAASGTPMIIGEAVRTVMLREKAIRRLIDEAHDDAA